MDEKTLKRVKEGNAKEEDFEYTKKREEELKALVGKDEALELFHNEIEFNKEVQIFVMNQMNKRKLTTNYVVGTLYKLAFGILNSDLIEQTKMMSLYDKGEK